MKVLSGKALKNQIFLQIINRDFLMVEPHKRGRGGGLKFIEPLRRKHFYFMIYDLRKNKSGPHEKQEKIIKTFYLF